ncbi:MAG: DnaA regulatory inactivator Hda [Pseudomonadota bacterium]
MPTQIPLHFEFRADQSFAHYHAGANAEAVACISRLAEAAGESLIFLWGGVGLGKTHLLQACCQRAHQSGASALYLPLKEMRNSSPELLEGLESVEVACIDEIETIAGDDDWEIAFFNFFNRNRDRGHRLVVAAGRAPADLEIRLPDLKSRLSWGLTLRLQPLGDDDKLAAITLKAKNMGLELSPQVGRFLLAHCPRDLPSLWALLSRLDHATLAAKRKLTLPFLKEYLENEP